MRVSFASKASGKGRSGIGPWAVLLCRFDNGQRLCTIREIQAFLTAEIDRLHSRGDDEIIVSEATVRKYVAKICVAESQTIDNGRVYSHYLSDDVREFGRQIQMGNRFLLDSAEKES